jgi:hypothetical protein
MDDRAKIAPFPADRANELRAVEEDFARIVAYRKARTTKEIRDTRAWMRACRGNMPPPRKEGV